MSIGLIRGYTRHLTPVSSGAARTDPLDRGLVGEWRFDPTTGLLLPDYSGYANHGVVTGADWVATEHGPGLAFVRANRDYVDCGNSDSLHPSEITVECFFRCDSDFAQWEERGYVSCQNWTAQDGWTLQAQRSSGGAGPGRVRWRCLGNGTNVTSQQPVESVGAGDFVHAIGTYNGVIQRLFINGQQEDQDNNANGVDYANANNIYIGRCPHFAGWACDDTIFLVRIYDRALSAAEVRARYHVCLKRGQAMTHVWMMPQGAVTSAPILVEPAATTSVASSTNPTTVLGSVSVAPTAKTTVASSVNPTTILGNIAIAAAATAAVVVCVIAAVLLSSIVAAPTAINTVATVVAPTILQGNLSIAPSAIETIAVGVDPTVVVGGSIIVTPSATTTIASSVNPTVALGSMSVAPSAQTAIASSIAPTVVQASMTVAPTTIGAVVSSVNPTTVEGGVSLTPTARSAVVSVVAPTVFLGSATATPTALTAIASSMAPTVVQNSLTVSPTAQSAVASSVNPTVVEGGITITPTAQNTVVSTVNPTVLYGSDTASPTATTAIASSVAPTIAQGGLSLSPTATGAVVSTVAPTVVISGITVSPSAITTAASTTTPTVVQASVAVSPAARSAIATSVAPTVLQGALSLTPAASTAIASSIDPTVATPTIVSPTATSVIASSVAPTVVEGSLSITPSARNAVASTVAPTALYGNATASPTAVSAVASSIDPSVGPFGTLFNITHEVGDLTEYDSTATDSGDLSVTEAAALAATSYGLQCFIDDGNSLFGRKEIDLTVKQLRARFYIDPNSLTMGSGDEFSVVRVWGTGLLAFVNLGYDGSSHEIKLTVWGEGSTAFYNITDAEHYIEFRLVRNSSAIASDGTADLWIDGVHQEQLTDLDIYTDMALDYIQMGACADMDLGTSGTLYLDELNGNDTGDEIGPISVIAPAAINTIALSINPTVVLSSITSSPTAISAVVSTVNPTVLVGDTVIAPSPITAIASTVAPAVVQASITIAPAAQTAIVTTTGPVVVISGDIAVAPAVSTAIALSMTPAVALSSVVVAPTAIGAVASTVSPTVVEGALSISPTATSAIASSVAPTIILSSTTVAPSANTAIALTVAPTVIVGGDVAVAPSAISAIATTAAPIIAQGSMGIAPTARTVIASTVAPTVITPTIVAPSAVSAIASSTGPSAVLYGSVSIVPSAIHAVATGVDPDVYAGEAAWSYTAGKLQGVGGGGSEWHGLLSQNSMPEAGHITFDKFNTRGAALIRATAKDTGYLVYWDADSVGVSYLDGGVETNLIDLPKIYGGDSTVEVAWREVQYTQDDPYRWLFITGYFDGELAVTYGDNIANQSIGNKVGFAVYGGDTITFDNICVPKFAVIGDWASLDENEAPGGALSRLIGQRHVRMFLRYDGTLRVWKPCAVDSSKTFTNALIENRVKIVDGRGLLSHVRVQGAFVSAETVDNDLLKAVGHRYARQDNPNLETEQECKDEAIYQLRRAEEDADLVELGFPMCVPLEPEDRITVPDGDYLITGVSFEGKPASLKATYKCRKYVT